MSVSQKLVSTAWYTDTERPGSRKLIKYGDKSSKMEPKYLLICWCYSCCRATVDCI